MSTFAFQCMLKKKFYWIFIISKIFFSASFSRPNWFFCSSCFLSVPNSGGGGRVGHDAGTDTWPFAGGGLSAQPGPAGGHLGHHTHWSTQAGRLPPAGHHVVPAAFPGEAGEEAARHQDGGEEEENGGEKGKRCTSRGVKTYLSGQRAERRRRVAVWGCFKGPDDSFRYH